MQQNKQYSKLKNNYFGCLNDKRTLVVLTLNRPNA
jgi:hypothetical protein